jgi:hypothetical protein
MTQLKKPYCEAGRCANCRPGTDTGCDQTSNKPDCRTNSAGQYECQGCASNADCEHAPRSLCNTSTGACVQCGSDDDCTDPTKPFCDTADGTCKGCGAAGGNAVANIWCIANTLTARPVCDRNSGRCVRCNANGGCNNGDQCRVDNSAPQNNQCLDCVDNSGCSGTNDRCNTATNTCIDCDANGGCSGTNDQCLIGAMPAMNACVDCINDNGCAGEATRKLCNTSTHACVECTQASQCAPDACTDVACTSNVCSRTPKPAIDDGYSCTEDLCDRELGTILHAPMDGRCTQDSNLCTVERCLGAAGGAATTGCGSVPACDAGVCDAGMCM